MEEHCWADEGHCGVERGCTEVAKSDSRDVHLSVLKVLPEVIRESVDAEQHPDYKKGEDGIRGVKNGVNEHVTIHRLYGAVNVDGKTCRVKVTLKEYADKNEPSRAYSYEATKIELLAGTLVDGKTTDPSTNNSITAANLLQNVENPTETAQNCLIPQRLSMRMVSLWWFITEVETHSPFRNTETLENKEKMSESESITEAGQSFAESLGVADQ